MSTSTINGMFNRKISRRKRRKNKSLCETVSPEITKLFKAKYLVDLQQQQTRNNTISS